MNKDKHAHVLESTVQFVRDTLVDSEGGHDWFHTPRMWKMAKKICEFERADDFVVQLGALLHDIADSKFHEGDESIGPKTAYQFLSSLNVEEEVILHVVNIIENISFKGGQVETAFRSIELDIVQDADRLDAMGAIGIARAFNYGGFKNRRLYDPSIKPLVNQSKEQYKASQAPTLNHFYEKLFLLKNKMNTATGKQLANERHTFMESYVKQFLEEWGGEV